MALDGLFLLKLKSELTEQLKGCRVDKIHQPSKEELVFLLRSKEGARRLLVSLRASAPRVHLTDAVYENPSEPPMFCMLLRKHLSGARFVEIEDVGLERIVIFCFEATSEMGDRVNVRFAVELVGKQTNAILIGHDGRIIDSVRRTDFENEGRIIQPGAVYGLPERRVKLDPTVCTADELCEAAIKVPDRLWKAVLDVTDGVSPLIAREILVSSGLDTDASATELSSDERSALVSAFSILKNAITDSQLTAVFDENGVPFEFSYMPITQYGASVKTVGFDSCSRLLDTVFGERDRKERIKSFSTDMSRILNNIHSRILKKTSVRKRELEATKEGEKWRIWGELLKANLYKAEKGAPYVDVENYYDPQLGTIRIPLNTALSPAKNAERYFKEYKKSCNAAAVLGELIADSEMELQYIESVIDELKRAKSVAELGEIRQELIGSGYLRATAAEKRRKVAVSKPEEVLSPDGFRVLIGRNNRQNDELTLKIANKDDMWFHTKNIPGSHVVVLCGDSELPESTVLFAAKKAAENSNARESSSVPVDYTRVRYVKKPAGAKPGLVIYKNNKTVYVTPER
ncbi:MAG: fibronectin/fibrinogen-binding protein [Ruminococcaceae bacterium]|nr:fibronectin/fibrinogen-binding protein [Oscillospiraceae bacterium]